MSEWSEGGPLLDPFGARRAWRRRIGRRRRADAGADDQERSTPEPVPGRALDSAPYEREFHIGRAGAAVSPRN